MVQYSDKEEMNVIWSTSDKYSEIAATSVTSLLINNTCMANINIYIIDMGISDIHKKWLEDIVDLYNRHITFVKMIDIEQKVGIKMNVGRWHISTFSRLFLTTILPESIKKILYLDCDVIVRHSLKRLWETDMKDVWVLGADDCRGSLYRTELGVDKESIYTNNGVMLIDLQAWRYNNVEKIFIEYIKKRHGDITYMDQGVLNGCLQPLGKVGLLPISYNAQTACYDLGFDGLEVCRKPVWAYAKETFERDIEDPNIVHFTTCFMSGTRPWHEKDKHKFRNEFLQYREMTPWKNEPLWVDNTPATKKMMSRICTIIPKFITFRIIRCVHVYVYPWVRKMKSR